MLKYLDDVLILLGCGVLVYATSLWSNIAAWYLVGIIFILGGVVLMFFGSRKGNGE